MLGEVIDTFEKDKIRIEIKDSYVYPDYTIYQKNRLIEQGCLHENITAENLYQKFINKESY